MAMAPAGAALGGSRGLAPNARDLSAAADRQVMRVFDRDQPIYVRNIDLTTQAEPQPDERTQNEIAARILRGPPPANLPFPS
jgi:hypothetical protein